MRDRERRYTGRFAMEAIGPAHEAHNIRVATSQGISHTLMVRPSWATSYPSRAVISTNAGWAGLLWCAR